MRALLFPGQGSQYVGMARELCERHPESRARFAEADRLLGFGLSQICFEGPEAELAKTSRTQPAVYVHSMALLAAWDGWACDFVAGHSLGEFSALTAAGAWDFATGLRLVQQRSAAMQAACDRLPGTMAAILNLPADRLEPLIAEALGAGIVQVANFNSPGQVAISGERPAVERVVQLATGFGARRALLLPVGGAFHSPLMEPARAAFADALSSVEIRPLRVPVVLNVTAEATRDPDVVRSLLSEQLTAPVQWERTLRLLSGHGVTEFVEVGPGKVLQGLVRRTLPDLETWGVDTAADLDLRVPVGGGR